MTKNEYIEKYGEEAYSKHLECQRQYKKQHKEENKQYQKQYREQHREEINEHQKKYYQQHKEKRMEYQKQYQQQHKDEYKQYKKQYYQQNKEEYKRYYQQHIEEKKQRYQQRREEINQYQKQYYQQHREEYKQWSRNNRYMFAYCIPEEIEQIENYELAKESNFNGWHIHHRLETHNSDGEKRLVYLSREELIALDMYYNRPANELIFLTKSEHMKLHKNNKANIERP